MVPFFCAILWDEKYLSAQYFFRWSITMLGGQCGEGTTNKVWN